MPVAISIGPAVVTTPTARNRLQAGADARRERFATRVVTVDFAGGPISVPGFRAAVSPVIALARFETEVCDRELSKGAMILTPAVIGARYGRGRLRAFRPQPPSAPVDSKSW